MKYYLNIGSNLGDKKVNLLNAIEAIEKALAVASQISDVIESEPWGFSSHNSFLNIGLAIESNLEPLKMLSLLQNIERHLGCSSHRNADGSYADRIVDIDIIAVDENVLRTPKLTIPHPLMHKRAFVLQPMIQLAPLWVHPIFLKTAQELLNELQNGSHHHE